MRQVFRSAIKCSEWITDSTSGSKCLVLTWHVKYTTYYMAKHVLNIKMMAFDMITNKIFTRILEMNTNKFCQIKKNQ